MFGHVNGMSGHGLTEQKYASWNLCPDILASCPDMACKGENRILELLSSLDQQLRLISVYGPIELKLCRHVHKT
jgi:hypothetical protein